VDLSNLAPVKEPFFVHLKHPVKSDEFLMHEGEAIGIYIVGTDSDEYAARERWLLDRRAKIAEARAMNKQAPVVDLQAEGLETIIACVKGWKNIILDGVNLEFTPDNVRAVLTRFRWIRDVLDREMANRANFIKG